MLQLFYTYPKTRKQAKIKTMAALIVLFVIFFGVGFLLTPDPEPFGLFAVVMMYVYFTAFTLMGYVEDLARIQDT